MNPKITMIGVSHLSRQTAKGLKMAFDELKPDVVTLEWRKETKPQTGTAQAEIDSLSLSAEKAFGEFGVKYCRDRFMGTLFRYYANEVASATQFCEKNGIPLILTDSSDIVEKIMTPLNGRLAEVVLTEIRTTIQDILDRGVTRVLQDDAETASSGIARSVVSNLEKRVLLPFHRFFKTGEIDPELLKKGFPDLRTALTENRENHQAKTILETIETHHPSHLLHIGGVLHCVEVSELLARIGLPNETPTLYERIKPLVSARFTPHSFPAEKQ